MTPATARQLALDVLATARPGDAFAWERLDAALGRAPLPPAERRLATQLVYGVLRRRGSLDALLRPLITRPLPKVCSHATTFSGCLAFSPTPVEISSFTVSG